MIASYMTDVLIRRKFGHRQTWGKMPCEDGGGGWSDAATSQPTPGAARSWKKQGSLLHERLWREPGPADTLISDF